MIHKIFRAHGVWRGNASVSLLLALSLIKHMQVAVERPQDTPRGASSVSDTPQSYYIQSLLDPDEKVVDGMFFVSFGSLDRRCLCFCDRFVESPACGDVIGGIPFLLSVSCFPCFVFFASFAEAFCILKYMRHAGQKKLLFVTNKNIYFYPLSGSAG